MTYRDWTAVSGPTFSTFSLAKAQKNKSFWYLSCHWLRTLLFLPSVSVMDQTVHLSCITYWNFSLYHSSFRSRQYVPQKHQKINHCTMQNPWRRLSFTFYCQLWHISLLYCMFSPPTDSLSLSLYWNMYHLSNSRYIVECCWSLYIHWYCYSACAFKYSIQK